MTMVPSTSPLATDSAAQLPKSSSPSAATALTPLQFCEILLGYWTDRSEGSLVPVPIEDPSKKNKGKGRAISSAQSTTSDSTTGNQQVQLQRKRLIREGKSLYVKVDLAASQSCVKHIELLQSDTTLRQEVEKLVSLAQTSSSNPTTASTPRKDSGNSITPPLSGSPAKRNFRNAQQLLHAEARAETLERRVYLRVLLSRTVLRYVEKHTGSKYLYEGDRVVHYKEASNKYSRKKKAQCVFYYQCASGEYEQPACGGTLRLVVDLDLGDMFSQDKDESTDEHDENEMSLDESAPSDVEDQPAQKASKPRPNGILPRTPITRTYGTKSRYSTLLSSLPLSSRSTRMTNGTAGASASKPSTSLSRADDPSTTHQPFVVALRLTHVKTHRAPYSVLRASYIESRLERQAKLDQIEQKMTVLQEELERLRRLQEDKDDLYERGVDKLWNKVKRAITPSDSEESEDDDASAAENQNFTDGGNAADQASEIIETEEEDTSVHESSKEWSQSEEEEEEEAPVSKDTIRTRSKKGAINRESDPSSQVVESSQVSKSAEPELPPRTSRSANKVIVVREVESVSSSSEHEEIRQQPINKSPRILRSKAKVVVREVRSTSPSNGETDYSEPEQPTSASAKRKRHSDKEMDVGRAATSSRGSARTTRTRQTAIRGTWRGHRGN